MPRPKGPKTTRVHVLLRRDLAKAMAKLAKEEGITRTAWLTRLIEDALKRQWR
jgi:hypothetical protein